jgi:hypothetical protein
LLLVLGALAAPRLGAQTSPYTPYQHRALYLYNFAKFTEWPKEAFADENAPFVLGILGTDPFGKDIEIIKGKTLKNRKLEVRYCASVQEAKGCHLLFISSSVTNQLEDTLKILQNTSVLTIAETEEFLQQSGIIKLVAEQKTSGTQTVAFEINLAAAGRANLKLDTQLLKLAKRVKS